MTLQPRPSRRRVSAASLRVIASLAVCALGTAQANDDPWYIGIGGTGSLLAPNSEIGLDVDEDQGTGGTVFLGRDLDRVKSVQLQLHGLGEASFDNGATVDYYAADASVLYRFFDSRDRSRGDAGVAFYGRFGLGYLERDSDAALEDDAAVWFGAGAGLEFMLNRTVALRAEALYLDTDVGTASLSIVARFGGGTRRPLTPPASAPTGPAATPPAADAPAVPTPTTPATPAAPAAPAAPGQAPGTAAPGDGARGQADVPPTTTPTPRRDASSTDAIAPLAGAIGPDAPALPSIDDRDGDGVANADDVCLRSAPGFPVQDNGCALFDGVLSRVRFDDGGDTLLPGAASQLDALAELLQRFPDSRIELHAHTDGRGDARDQAIITRARLRTIGTYLVGKGISANRLVLRSFGGSRPVSDGTGDEAVERNNRIEVLENTR